MERVWKDILQVVLSELGRDHELAQVSKGNEELWVFYLNFILEMTYDFYF